MAYITRKLSRWAVAHCTSMDCGRTEYVFGDSEVHNPLKKGDIIPSTCLDCGSTLKVEIVYTDPPAGYGTYIQVYREVPVGLI